MMGSRRLACPIHYGGGVCLRVMVIVRSAREAGPDAEAAGRLIRPALRPRRKPSISAISSL